MEERTPKGFVGLQAAIDQCGKRWGHGDPATLNWPKLQEFRYRVWSKLRTELHSGALPSYYLNGHGAVKQLPAEDRYTRWPVDINAWFLDLNNEAYRDGKITFWGLDAPWSAPAYVKEDDLQAFLVGKSIEPPLSAAAQPSAPSSEPTQEPNPELSRAPNKGGPPTKYDGEAFLIEAFFLLYDGLQPKTQAELRQSALEAYGKTLGQGEVELPSDEWAKPKIRALWYRLGLDRGR